MKDPNLRRCSRAARGMWVDILCLMFECEDRGVLMTGGEPWSDEDIAAAVGGDISEGLACITELLRKGVAHRNGSGAIFSRRMARDEQIRQERARAGQIGGSKAQANLKQTAKQKPTPSSSPSGSDATASGAQPRAPDIWSLGVPLLTRGGVMTEPNARSLLGRLEKQYGEAQLASAIGVTSRKNPANPKEYLMAVLSREQAPRTQAEVNRAGKGVVV